MTADSFTQATVRPEGVLVRRRSLVRDDDHRLAQIGTRMHGQQGLASPLETLKSMLAVCDLALENQWRHDLVGFPRGLGDFASTADEALDRDTPLEDLLEMLHVGAVHVSLLQN